MIAGGSSYDPKGYASGPGTTEYGFAGWQSGTNYVKTVVTGGGRYVSYVGAAWAWASCVDATAAPYFQWVSAASPTRRGDVGATCPAGWVLVSGFATGNAANYPQWQYWEGTQNNAYWAEGPTAWASCGVYPLVNVRTSWGNAPKVLQTCPTRAIAIGGGTGFMGQNGKPRYLGPSTQQYPNAQHGKYTGWWTYGKTTKLLNIIACFPRYP